MLQDRKASVESHSRFVRRVVESREVWGLRGPEGWATAPSNEYEDASVMPFWSDCAYAARAAKDEWSEMEPTSIPLEEFIDAWLRGMHDEGVLVGTNWDANNCGIEIEPAELAQGLADGLDGQRTEPDR